MKQFGFDGVPVETRLLVRHDDGDWAGYSYRWRDDLSDADLLEAGDTKPLENGNQWAFPSREQCLTCHTVAAGRTLGLETSQLNGEFDYPGSRRSNQLATLEHIGVFAEPPGDPAAVPKYPVPSEDAGASVEERARSYLHANCSHCHRPSGVEMANIDLRFATALADMSACNVAPLRNNLGIPDARIIQPGNALDSILSIRMHSVITNLRMPPIGRSVVDDDGVAIIDEWLTNLRGCE
jgi:uncharacterized repeat protein (TIGR03806 family)